MDIKIKDIKNYVLEDWKEEELAKRLKEELECMDYDNSIQSVVRWSVEKVLEDLIRIEFTKQFSKQIADYMQTYLFKDVMPLVEKTLKKKKVYIAKDIIKGISKLAIEIGEHIKKEDISIKKYFKEQ